MLSHWTESFPFFSYSFAIKKLIHKTINRSVNEFFHSKIYIELQKQRFLLIIPQRPVRESNPHLVLRRAPIYCHSLSIWGKVNPYGTLYKTVSDSIWVILNTPSVKLCKALKVSWLFAPANNRGMPWYYHRHLLYDHHASYVRSW